MSHILHIVSFDAPSPPDYGGAIDVYYKVKALSKAGYKVILHFFNYKQGRHADDLGQYCLKIYSYKRETGLKGISFTTPYIVSSRINKELINNLNADDHSILLEGIHCSGLLPYLNVSGRKVLVRVHNDEAVYYGYLAKTEPGLFKRMYFSVESILLKNYQEQLSKEITYACLSQSDAVSLQSNYKWASPFFLPCFLPWQAVTSLEGSGEYCLYHGNLSVAENAKAVEWLLQNVFNVLEVPFIIAGKNIPSRIQSLAKKYPHISLISNPSNDELSSLIKKAHINLLPSFNRTGVKFKLLHALFEGRFCITNKAGMEGSGIEKGIHLAETANDYIEHIKQLMQKSFTSEAIEERKRLLSIYDNQINALKLSALL